MGETKPVSVSGTQHNGYEASKSAHTCYFCNEFFELGQLQIHLKHCGSILEQCPLRCGAWIQRKHKEVHVPECPQMKKARNSGSLTHARPPDPATPLPAVPGTNHTWSPGKKVDDCVTYLEKEVANIKLILTEEVQQRDLQASEIQSIHAKLQRLDERGKHLDEDFERTADLEDKVNHDLTNVQLALQDLQNQQIQTAMRLEEAVGSIVQEQNERELLEQAITHHDNTLRNVSKLEEVIEYIKQALQEERERNSESRSALETELMQARRSSEQLTQLVSVRQLLQAPAEAPTIDRLAVLEVSTADARAECLELTSKVDTLSRDLRALTKSYAKIRNELVDFQTRVTFGSQEIGSYDGHLLWRVDNFAIRMKESKENDAVITSPLFRTSKYGYTLKAEVHLNGIGKWKGRHITCTVRLVSGPFDPVLQWPCDVKVNIVLKDQPSDRNQAMDIVKSLDVRRKSSSKRHDYDEGGEQSAKTDGSLIQLKRQYIFIPHTSLDKFEYIKNDVAFFEFVVVQ